MEDKIMCYKFKTYKTELFIIETDDLNPEVYSNFGDSEMIDFYLHYKDTIYNGCSFTLKDIKYHLNEYLTYNNDDSKSNHYHFWHKDMIIIKHFSIECLILSINEIINDDTKILEEIFTVVDNSTYFSD